LAPQSIVYHDPCHLRFAKITDPPRELLRQAPALTCLELPHGPRCCGHGGLFHIAHADLSRRIAKPLVDDFLSTGATLVVSSCSGCLLQWQQNLAATGAKVEATHLALLLVQQLMPAGG
jgi:glycolate oxidase iron-sulfur subunit